MWVSGKILWGLGELLGVSTGTSEAQASGLHGGGAMEDDGTGEISRRRSGNFFSRRRDLEEGPRLSGEDKVARAAVVQCRPRHPR
jgi:hypothetical protein